MNITNMLVGLVFIAIVFIAINLAVPQIQRKNYIPEEDTAKMEELGKKYVSEAKPSGLSSIFLYFSSALAAIKTAFDMVTTGIPNMIKDVFGIMGIPGEITTLVSGLIVFITALYVLAYISGRLKKP